MNVKHQPFRLTKILQNEFEAWTGIYRFLVGIKSNNDFDGFFSRQTMQELCSDDRPHRGLYPPANIKRESIADPVPEHRRFTAFRLGLFITVLFFLLTPLVRAHGGVSINIDNCSIPVENQWVHFTAYTPDLTQDTEYCKSIPDLGRTNLVFDYESRVLRKMTVEFEVTKEPEGIRVYHQDPKAHQSGSVNAAMDFNEFGPGEYLAHVTLVNAGKKIDAHLPFSVEPGGGLSSPIWLVGLTAFSGLIVVYFFRPKFHEKISRIDSAGTPSS